MAVKIPQNIEREDKLVGPLTLRQFLYVLGGGALMFSAYQGYAQGFLFFHEFILISFIVGGLAVSLAFVNINGRPFTVFVGSLFSYIFATKTRLWGKTNTLANEEVKIISSPQQQSSNVPTEEMSKSDLEKLATVLDTGGKMKTGDEFANTHEINTLPQIQTPPPEIMEEDLNLEDIFDETDI